MNAISNFTISRAAIETTLIFVFLNSIGTAQDVDWNNSTGAANPWYQVGSNWVGNATPNSTQTARFNLAGSYDVWWDSTTAAVTPQVGVMHVLNGNVTLRNQDASQNLHTVNGSGGGGSFSDLSISGNATSLTLQGLDLTSLGGAELHNGATLNVDGSHVAGSRFAVGGSAGFRVDGNFNVQSSGIASGTTAFIGRESGAFGAATVSGAGSTWTNSSYMYVGYSGTGTLNVNSGATVSNDVAYVGRWSTGQGTVNVSGANSQWNGTSLWLGYLGNGTLNISGGGHVSNGTTYMARYGGTTGNATISDATSQWSHSGNLYIGGHSSSAGGTADLNINDGMVSVNGLTKLWAGGTLNLDGGTLSTRSLDNTALGTINFNSGTLEITGAGGYFNPGTANFVVAGDSAIPAPVLTISNGAQASLLDSFKIGNTLGNHGSMNIQSGSVVQSSWGDIYGNSSVSVSGPGTQWNLSDSLVAMGSLQINNSAEVNSVFGTVDGVMTVTGDGSQFNSDYLTIGITSDGLVNIQNNAVFNVNDLQVGQISFGTMNIQNGAVVNSNDGHLGYHDWDIGEEHGGGLVTVTDSQWLLANDLVVGSDAPFNGGGTLYINNGSLVSVNGTTLISDLNGSVSLDGGRFEFGSMVYQSFDKINATSGSMAGIVSHSAGTWGGSQLFAALRDTNVTTSDVIVKNSGTIYGNATLEAGLENVAGGEILALGGAVLRFTGGTGNLNSGIITNDGSTVHFDQGMRNQSEGFISGNGQFVADGGWINEGVMSFSAGNTGVLGDVVINSSGQIVTSGGATTTFYDDVVHNGTEIRTASGGNTVFFGAQSGAGTFTGTGMVSYEGNLRPGNSPDVIDYEGGVVFGTASESFFELGGLNLGEYDRLNIDGDLTLNGQLTVDLVNGFNLGFNQEFVIADVAGLLSGEYDGLGEGALVGNFSGMDLFISYVGGDGNDVQLFTSVPEPATAGLCSVVLLAFALIRRRRLR